MSLGVPTKQLRENGFMSSLGYIEVLCSSRTIDRVLDVDPSAATTRSNKSLNNPVKLT